MDWAEIAIIATGILGAVVMGLHIHIAIMERRAIQAYRTATASCNLVHIMGPHPAMAVPVHNGMLAMQAIPVGGYAIVNIENGDIEYSFPRDTNHSMETNFSLDELEEAREFINGGGKLH